MKCKEAGGENQTKDKGASLSGKVLSDADCCLRPQRRPLKSIRVRLRRLVSSLHPGNRLPSDNSSVPLRLSYNLEIIHTHKQIFHFRVQIFHFAQAREPDAAASDRYFPDPACSYVQLSHQPPSSLSCLNTSYHFQRHSRFHLTSAKALLQCKNSKPPPITLGSGLSEATVLRSPTFIQLSQATTSTLTLGRLTPTHPRQHG